MCPLYSLLDSGISSPDTIYNMAPAAKLRQIAITVSEIEPIIAPTSAPIPVVTPDKNTYKSMLDIFIHPFFMGTAIEIPSGTSWIAIAIARESPKLNDDSKPEPIASPSGKL